MEPRKETTAYRPVASTLLQPVIRVVHVVRVWACVRVFGCGEGGVESVKDCTKHL